MSEKRLFERIAFILDERQFLVKKKLKFEKIFLLILSVLPL